jgi:glycosyltransferase involved in cell wall biosynthesis
VSGRLRVLLDFQAFELQRWGGISRLFLELARGLRDRADVEVAMARSVNGYVPELNRLLGLAVTGDGHPETFLGGARVPLRRQLWSIRKRLSPRTLAPRLNRERALARLRAGGFDLFHPTYFDPYFLEALGDRPFVLTVHDLAHDVFPALFPGDVTAERRRRLAARAARIIAVSEWTRRDVVERLGVDPAKVDVVHHGFAWAAPPAPPPSLPERYVLYTGTRHAYKNWGFFVTAAAPLLLGTPGLHLVCTGHPFSRDERALLARTGLAARTVHVAAEEGTLRALYAGARAFVFPSLYEGFGFPVLEAFAEGCPAALARTSSLPEVGGDAALYFDPTDAGALRGALARLLGDDALRAELAARGRARAKAFTWERTCAATLDVYRRALGERVPGREEATR